jgi:hypothetical protein
LTLIHPVEAEEMRKRLTTTTTTTTTIIIIITIMSRNSYADTERQAAGNAKTAVGGCPLA